MCIATIGRKLCFLPFLYLLGMNPLFARDVDIDRIYISNGNSFLGKLSELKHKSYRIIDSVHVDSTVIYASWFPGNRIIYVKEYFRSGTNEIFEYSPVSGRRKKIAFVRGAVVGVKNSLNGRYLFLKLIHIQGFSIKCEIAMVSLGDGTIIRKQNMSALPDFTVSIHGDKLYYESQSGIMEYQPEDGSEKLCVPEHKYRNFLGRNNPTLAYFSSVANRVVLINGGGGQYRSLLIDSDGAQFPVQGTTSASELYWIDNHRFVSRHGGPSSYTVSEYDVESASYSTLAGPSLNTNISYSAISQRIAFNIDGIIAVYFIDSKLTKFLPLEGEDVFFSPDGQFFVSLLGKRLYLSRYDALGDEYIELKRNASEILELYRRIRLYKENLLNEYSDYYIDRKISVYQKLAR